METNGQSFLQKVYNIVRQESADDVPLIDFKHPTELQDLLDLDVTTGVTDDQLEVCVRQVLRYSVKTCKSTFRNQLYGATDPYGLAGAWVSEAFNTSQYTFEVAPAFTLVELKMIDHVLKLFGLSEGDGIFSPGGSMCMLYAIVAARFKAFPQVKTKGMRDLPELVMFTSEDSHYSIMKAAHWLGLGTESIRFIKVDEDGKMDTEKLERAIENERILRRYPLLVNATAGTTVLGAIDDLDAVADVCKKYGVWMHVDACWGGSLMLSPKYKSRLKGIEKADSFSWNPHKMAGAPLQCSIVAVRERGLLHSANSAAAQYLFQQDKHYDVHYDTGDKSVQCGRKIDAFKLWVMWKARGDAGLQILTDHVMEMAEFCIKEVARRPGFRLVATRIQCPNICFWYIPPFLRGKKEDNQWWEVMHKVTPKIKQMLTLKSQAMISYSPLRQHKNFFRLALTFHPNMDEKTIESILEALAENGDSITQEDLVWESNGVTYNSGPY